MPNVITNFGTQSLPVCQIHGTESSFDGEYCDGATLQCKTLDVLQYISASAQPSLATTMGSADNQFRVGSGEVRTAVARVLGETRVTSFLSQGWISQSPLELPHCVPLL